MMKSRRSSARGGGAVGVRSRSGVHKADALIINADFARAMTNLVPDRLRRRWTNRTISRKRFSCSTFMLYLGIEGCYDHLSHHTIHLAKDYVRNLEDIETRHVLSDDPSFYVQNASVTDPTLAPPGCSTLYVLLPVTHQHPNVDWARDAGKFRALALRQLAKLGLHDVEFAYSVRENDHPGRLGSRPSDPSGLDFQPGAQSLADASPPTSQPVRGP